MCSHKYLRAKDAAYHKRAEIEGEVEGIIRSSLVQEHYIRDDRRLGSLIRL